MDFQGAIYADLKLTMQQCGTWHPCDGTEFVGIGVMPDIEVTQTVAAFRDGRNLVLERAVAVLQERMR